MVRRRHVVVGLAAVAVTLSGCVEAGSPTMRRYVDAVVRKDYATALANVCPEAVSVIGDNEAEMAAKLDFLLEKEELSGPISVHFLRRSSTYGTFVLNGDNDRQRLGEIKRKNGVPCPDGSLLGKISSW